MAGLFAAWAAASSPLFSAVASASGSLWYEGLEAFWMSTPCIPGYAYFSVGDRERMSRNPAFRAIEERTRSAAQLLGARGARTFFETNPGGHFVQPAQRLARGIQWLIDVQERRTCDEANSDWRSP